MDDRGFRMRAEDFYIAAEIDQSGYLVENEGLGDGRKRRNQEGNAHCYRPPMSTRLQ